MNESAPKTVKEVDLLLKSQSLGTIGTQQPGHGHRNSKAGLPAQPTTEHWGIDGRKHRCGGTIAERRCSDADEDRGVADTDRRPSCRWLYIELRPRRSSCRTSCNDRARTNGLAFADHSGFSLRRAQ